MSDFDGIYATKDEVIQSQKSYIKFLEISRDNWMARTTGLIFFLVLTHVTYLYLLFNNGPLQ